MTTKYREVKRKAAVGERIKIVSAWSAQGYANGDEFTVTGMRLDNTSAVDSVVERTLPIAILAREYVVLEPIAQPIAPSPLTSDPLYAAFRQFVADNADELRKLLPELEAPGISVGGIVDAPFTVADSGAVIARKPKPLTRAQEKQDRAAIIAKATADVAEIEKHANSGSLRRLGVAGTNASRLLDVEYNVNREKRAINVILRGQVSCRIYAKHTAKCSPADVFHAEIGKAIALRKALGLTVPTEYTHAPQPEELGAGTVVHLRVDNRRYEVCGRCPEKDQMFNIGLAYWLNDGWDGADNFVNIDDTDVDYSVNADSVVSTKGVAA